MDPFQLTRALIDIESITGNEPAVGAFVLVHLQELALRHSGEVERHEVEPGRFNVFAHWGAPVVTLSTHLDTVPPFIPSREDGEFIWGRGACDAKGIAVAMIAAAEKLLARGVQNFGLLFVVGEERNSAGAKVAAQTPRGSKFLINGEPTENRLALGSKGALRLEIHAHGRMAHSAYPELGDSAINKLLDVLQDVRRVALPEDKIFGLSTLNIGTISGGRAPNVVPDEAHAEILVRLVGPAAEVRDALNASVAGRAEIKDVLCIPAIRLESLDGLPTTVVSYTTDIPAFEGNWGRPFLIGPGSIHVAHTTEERIAKRELMQAIDTYASMVERLLRTP